MYMKKCPECGKKSYSASDRGEWSCPYCGKDLTKLRAETPDNNPDNKEKEE